MSRRDLVALLVLSLLPAAALAPGWWEGRLLGPGDGAILHYPLRAAVWESLRHGSFPGWNAQVFSGMPLLASYRPGALYPPMWALAFLPGFVAFQVLVVGSLSAAGVVTYVLLRRLRASVVGAYTGGLFYSLGPYLIGHLDDTPTLVAAPLLPLSLLAAESWVDRHDRRSLAGLATAVALLLLAGSPEAARGGLALVAGRLGVAHVFRRTHPGPRLAATLAGIGAALLLAAPQLLPTLEAARHAGEGTVGRAPLAVTPLPGFTGLVLRYASHTPAPALALAAAPLALSETPILVSGVGLLLCLGLQKGQGPLAAPGSLALVFDFTLSIVAALSLGAQWRARREARGRRLRAYFLFAALASAAALSTAAALLGPLPQGLAGAVGILALSLILYFANAASTDPVAAHLWLLPLTVSFLLQPQGRDVLTEAASRTELDRGTPTKVAVDRALSRSGGRVLTLVRSWPRGSELDLAFPNIGALSGRPSAGGYDPLAPNGPRDLFDGMTTFGALPGAFLRSDPLRLVPAGVPWLQVPASALVARGDSFGLGETLDLVVEAGRPRFLPTPFVAATEVHLATWMSEAVGVPQGATVARVVVRIATGQEIALPLRAGIDTAEWAYERPDVRERVAHGRARILESFRAPAGSFEGHHYEATLRMPSRFFVSGLRIERAAGPGTLVLSRLALVDATSRRTYPLALAAAFVSDTTRLREVSATPAVRLFEVEPRPALARVVGAVRELETDDAVLDALREPTVAGLDPLAETVATRRDARGIRLPPGSRPGPATVVGKPSSRLEVRAEGPGLLVVAETWDPGWSVRVDGRGEPLFRVEHARLGIVAPAGVHRFELHYAPPGLDLGLLLAGAGLALLAFIRI